MASGWEPCSLKKITLSCVSPEDGSCGSKKETPCSRAGSHQSSEASRLGRRAERSRSRDRMSRRAASVAHHRIRSSHPAAIRINQSNIGAVVSCVCVRGSRSSSVGLGRSVVRHRQSVVIVVVSSIRSFIQFGSLLSQSNRLYSRQMRSFSSVRADL